NVPLDTRKIPLGTPYLYALYTCCSRGALVADLKRRGSDIEQLQSHNPDKCAVIRVFFREKTNKSRYSPGF
ncbi:MAG: hypothetical protein Q7R34_10940, partial [Dehalococcoidia bacterium]|nr:hypothetical protein [Dehalococcoidia bacterium]